MTRHTRFVLFQLAEVAVTRNLFAVNLDRIARLALLPPLYCRRLSRDVLGSGSKSARFLISAG